MFPLTSNNYIILDTVRPTLYKEIEIRGDKRDVIETVIVF